MNREQPITFVVDDEPNAAQLLQNLLQPFPLFGRISVFTSATQAFSEVVNQKPDYLFLDIQMPELTGLQLTEKIKSHTPQTKIIYVTAFEQFALVALRQNAYDYLLKPLEKTELVRLVDKLLSQKEKDDHKTPGNTILVHSNEGMYQIKLDEIVFLEADSAYTTIVLNKKKPVVATVNMGKISLSLPAVEFIRISRKNIVNRSYVTFYHSRDKFVKLETGDKEYKLEVTLKVHEIKDLLSFI